MSRGVKGERGASKLELFAVGHGDDVAARGEAFGEDLASFCCAVVEAAPAACVIAMCVCDDRGWNRKPRIDVKASDLARKATSITL